MSKYYAVKKGRDTGIFTNWETTKTLVNGYKGAQYKSFKTMSEAQNYIHGKTSVENPHSNNVVYTDGSCVNKVGGYGYVFPSTGQSVYGKVPYNPCTNQIAELYAIYHLLSNTNGPVVIYTDSKYSIGCLTEWWYNWEKNGWKNSKNEPVKNKDLIQSILELSKNRDIKYAHVYGHNGDKYNEIADKLANQGRS